MTPPDSGIALHAVDDAGQIAAVAQLARAIWPEHYTPIIGIEQVEYMLARLQSEEAIAAQLTEGYEYFLLGSLAADGVPTWQGYFAARAETLERRLFVSKLYVHRAARRSGLGSAAIAHLVQLARSRNLDTLWLTVNKYNPTLQQYLRWGFTNVGAVISDIGDGYVMDDFKLEKPVD